MVEFSLHIVRSVGLLYLVMFGIWGNFLAVVVSEDDVRCLRGVKNSLEDPNGRLTSWNFSNTSVGFICNFVGVSCWNDLENRIISLELREMNLGGEVPSDLQYCSSVLTLDLSGNRLSGPIPSQICEWLPYLVSIDLSNNALTGPIPEDIVKCSYLNTIVLDSNKLSGGIPHQFANMNRLKKFSVANNDLTGRVPPFRAGAELNFTGNDGLCGGPIRKCKNGMLEN